MKKPLPYTILYVEDEERIRDSYTAFLSRRFCRVFSTGDGEEALKIYEEKRPDILLSDIMLPGRDGLSLIKEIRKRDDNTRMIVMSAYSDREKLLKATELNITKYLIKPIRKEELESAIERAVSQLEKLSPPTLELSCGCRFDKKRLELLHEGREVDLTPNEKIFIAILASEPGSFFTTEKISELFYIGYDKDLSIDAVKSLIKRIKTKLPYQLIENRFAKGYRVITNDSIAPT